MEKAFTSNAEENGVFADGRPVACITPTPDVALGPDTARVVARLPGVPHVHHLPSSFDDWAHTPPSGG